MNIDWLKVGVWCVIIYGTYKIWEMIFYIIKVCWETK